MVFSGNYHGGKTLGRLKLVSDCVGQVCACHSVPLFSTSNDKGSARDMSTTTFKVDGQNVKIDGDPQMPLLYALRDELGLNNPKFGCGLAQCGACTVHLNGVATRSCVLPISAVANQSITTLKGLGTPERPHPLQSAFVEEQVTQCGYCVNGWLMTAAALLQKNPRASEAQIKDGLKDLKCRCGSHLAILRAVKRAQTALLAKGALA